MKDPYDIVMNNLVPMVIEQTPRGKELLISILDY